MWRYVLNAFWWSGYRFYPFWKQFWKPYAYASVLRLCYLQ